MTLTARCSGPLHLEGIGAEYSAWHTLSLRQRLLLLPHSDCPSRAQFKAFLVPVSSCSFPWSCSPDQGNPPSTTPWRTGLCLDLDTSSLLSMDWIPYTVYLRLQVFPDRKVQIIFSILYQPLLRTSCCPYSWFSGSGPILSAFFLFGYNFLARTRFSCSICWQVPLQIPNKPSNPCAFLAEV